MITQKLQKEQVTSSRIQVKKELKLQKGQKLFRKYPGRDLEKVAIVGGAAASRGCNAASSALHDVITFYQSGKILNLRIFEKT